MLRLPRSETLNLFLRAVGYAATALAALVAGFALENKGFVYPDLVLLFALWVVSLPFFLHYAMAFHPPSTGAVSKGALGEAESTAKIFLPVGSGILLLLLLSHYKNLKGVFPEGQFFILAGLVIATFYPYGLYLSKTFQATYVAEMRHRLIWPVVLTITFNLYIGFLLAKPSLSALSFAPVFVTVGVFGVTFKTPRMIFLSLTLGPTILLIVLVSALPANVPPEFSNFAYYLGLAAYLAVFEAWNITTQFAHTESPSLDASEVTPQTTTFKHYIATGQALCVAALALPLYFLFTDLGRWFFIYAAIGHFVISFGLWYWAGGRTESQALRRLTAGWWLWGKTAAGYTFLAILVWDTLSAQHPQGRLAVDLLDWGFYFGVTGIAIAIFGTAGIVFFLLSTFVQEIPQLDVVGPLTSSRRGYLGTLCVLSFALAFVPLFIHEASRSFSDADIILFKAERVYHWYILVALSSLAWLMVRNGGIFAKTIVDTLEIFREGRGDAGSSSNTTSSRIKLRDRPFTNYPTQAAPSFGNPMVRNLSAKECTMSVCAILASSRLATSLLIGLTVLGPALANGVSGADALWWATPFILSAAAGFLLNDYFDAARDRISKPYRMIPQGRLRPSLALRSATMISLLAGLLLVLSPVELWLRLLQVLALVGVLVYNYILRSVAFIKGLYTAGLTALPLIFVLVAIASPASLWILPVSALLYVTSRETFMDLLDEEGDRATGLHTPAVVLGQRRATGLAFSLGVLALLVLSILVLLADAPHEQLLLLGSISCSVLLGALWLRLPEERRRTLVRLSWIPMLLGVAVLL